MVLLEERDKTVDKWGVEGKNEIREYLVGLTAVFLVLRLRKCDE